MAQNLPRIIRPFTVALPAAHPQPAAAAEGRQRLAATAGVGGQAFTGHLWPSQGGWLVIPWNHVKFQYIKIQTKDFSRVQQNPWGFSRFSPRFTWHFNQHLWFSMVFQHVLFTRTHTHISYHIKSYYIISYHVISYYIHIYSIYITIFNL